MLRKGKGRLVLGLGTTLMMQMATEVTFAAEPGHHIGVPARCAPAYPPATPSYCPPAVGPHTPPVEPAVPSGEKPMADPNAGPVPPAAAGDNGNQFNPDALFNNQNQVQNQAFNPNAQAQNTTVASRSSVAPNMIGDLFGTGSAGGGTVGGIIFPIPYLPSGGNLGAAPGASVGRMKLTENTSPIPRDRVFVNYSFFNNTPVGSGGQDVSRITPGVEKTFLDGNASIEVRTPFAATLDSTSAVNPINVDTNNAEFGNMSIYLKGLLFDTETFAVSSGLGIALPTAKDVRVYDAGGNVLLLQVENESTHLLPFFATLYTPNDRLFVQTMLQFDFDTTGNTVYVPSDANLVTKAHDANYVFASASAGYWMYLNPHATGFHVSGIAPIAELHYNGNMNSATAVVTATGTSFVPSDIQLLNGLVGLNARFGCGTNLTVAYAAPLTGGSEQFDGELRVMFNWFFGPSGGNGTRATRAQF